jgi:hypothetical protein
LQAVGVAVPDSAEQFLVAAFVKGVQEGGIELAPPQDGGAEEAGGEEMPPEEQAA